MASSQTKVLLKVGVSTMTATLTDNEATRELTKLLEQGDITLTLSLESSSGIENVTADDNKEEIIYDLNGRRITKKPLAPGIYIINGKKHL
ncbi:MAG: hypothetical protein HDS01_01590 [Bacteroides sp.]|nr:hypothetical protein [Bacteroides sp.]